MEVRVLGPLEVRRGGRPVALGARMERALLTILVLEDGRVVPADRLTDLLWDGAPPPRAAAALHTKVAHLRRALQPDRTPRTDGSMIVTAAPGYRLAREHLALDADRFESLVTEATQLQGDDDARALQLADQALALWRGPAFGEFGDETFARAAAERLETLRLAAVELRAAATLRLGDTAGAVAALQPHVAAQPLREPARAELARALYLAGRQAEALAVLGEGRRLLRDELGLDPGPDLRRLEQQILEQDPSLAPTVHRPAPGSASAATSEPRPLPGREAECTLLAQVVAEASTGSGSVVLLTGDAGMGKSALLDLLRRTCASAGGPVRAATCRGGITGPPFWPVLQMIRAAVPELDSAGRTRLAGALGPLRDAVPGLAGPDRADPPPTGGVDPAMVLMHTTDALDLVLGSAAEGGVGLPALVAFDDLHAADPATLQLVGGLASGVHRTRTVLALALRSGEGSGHPSLVDTLAALGPLPRVQRLDLGPLPSPVVEELVRAEAGGPEEEDRLAEIVERAEGNPFFALELARIAGAPETASSPGHGRPVGGVPASVYDVLRRRFLRLPEGGTDLLAAAAVAGTPVSVDDIAVITGLSPDRVLDLIDVAVDARLLTDVGDGRVAPAHALLGEAVLAAQSSARLVRLHRAFGDRLAARHGTGPDEASRIAAHYVAARALDGGAAALVWLERAADHALRMSALDQLRDLAGRVLDLLADHPGAGHDPGRYRRELHARGRIAFVDVWHGGMDSPTVREFCRMVRSRDIPGPGLRSDMELLWLATLFSSQIGRLDDAEELVQRMAALDAALDDPTATWLRFDMTGVVRWMQARFLEALEHLDRAEQAAATGVDLDRSLAFSPATRIAVLRAHCRWHLGDRTGAREQIDRALAAAEAAGFGTSGFARRWALILALMDRDVDRVRELVDRRPSEPAWERFRYPSAVVHFARGWADAQDGAPVEGLAAMRTAHATLAEQGRNAGRPVLLGLMAEVALQLGLAAEARSLCAAGLAIGERGDRYWLPELERLAAAAAEVSPPQARHQRAAGA